MTPQLKLDALTAEVDEQREAYNRLSNEEKSAIIYRRAIDSGEWRDYDPENDPPNIFKTKFGNTPAIVRRGVRIVDADGNVVKELP